jgi:hypothetical protein
MKLPVLLVVAVLSPLAVSATDWDPSIHGFPGISPRELNEIMDAAEAGALDHMLPPKGSSARAATLRFPEACLQDVTVAKMGLNLSAQSVPPRVFYATRMGPIDFSNFQVAAAKVTGGAPADVFDFYAVTRNELYLNDRPDNFKGQTSLDGAYVRLYAQYLRAQTPTPAQLTPKDLQEEGVALRAWFRETFIVGKADPCAWAPSGQK